MTITQTIEIPADHRLTIEVPREVPAGPALVTFAPAGQENPEALPEKRKFTLPKEVVEEILGGKTLAEVLSQPTPLADSLAGVAKDLGDITLEQIREERLVEKYLK